MYSLDLTVLHFLFLGEMFLQVKKEYAKYKGITNFSAALAGVTSGFAH